MRRFGAGDGEVREIAWSVAALNEVDVPIFSRPHRAARKLHEFKAIVLAKPRAGFLDVEREVAAKIFENVARRRLVDPGDEREFVYDEDGDVFGMLHPH